MWNSLTNIALIVSVVASSIVAIRILSINHKSTQNKLLFATILFSIAWSLFIFITILTGNFWVAKASFAVSAFVPCFLILFILYFSNSEHKNRYAIYVAVPSILIAALCFIGNLLFQKISAANGYIVIDKAGILLPVFYTYFFVYSLLVVVTAYHALKKMSGIKKIQLKFVVFGALISLFLASLVNLILPLFGFYQYNGIGPSFTFILTVSIFYALTKHNLLNSKVYLSEIWSLIAFLSVLFWFLMAPNTSNMILFVFVSTSSFLLVISSNGEAKKMQYIEKLAKELEAANKNLKELDKMKDDFLSMASHELNTPLAAIEGYLSMMLDEGMAGGDSLNPQTREYLDRIYSSSTRLAEIVRGLLNVSRIESGRIHLIYSEIQVEELIKQSVAEIDPKLKEKKHAICVELPVNPLPKTWADATRVTEIIINLLGNAIKYTDDGGHIEVGAREDRGELLVWVKDNGRGIPKDKANVVFQKFSQVDVLKDEVKGTGLGMYISQKFVELHKGRIWFESEGEGKGTTFFFTLPILKDKPYDPNEGEGPVLR